MIKQSSNDHTANDDDRHQVAQRLLPWIRCARINFRKIFHHGSGHNKTDVGNHPEKGIKPLSLILFHSIVGELPKEERKDHRTPKLCKNVEN